MKAEKDYPSDPEQDEAGVGSGWMSSTTAPNPSKQAAAETGVKSGLRGRKL